MSVSPLHEPRWYTFDIPFLPEGSGWVVCHERQVEGRIERWVTDPLTPTTLYHTFGAWIWPAGDRWSWVSDDCRVEDRRRVHVRLDPAAHDVLAGKMAAARWSVVDLGAYLAARELVAMLEAPDAREQAFAQRALRAAGREIDDARLLLQQHEAWGGRSAPVPRATDAVAQADAPQPGLVLVVRAFFAPPNFMRDVGVHWGSKGGTDPWALPTTPATRSWMSFLDDTQVSILVRASEKSPTLRNVVVRELALPAGEPGVVDLGPCGRLTVEASLSQNRKFVDARVAVRRLLAEGLRFHPHRRIVLPVGGTVLLCAYDDHGPAIDETDPICFVLTLDSAAGAQVAAPGDSGEPGS